MDVKYTISFTFTDNDIRKMFERDGIEANPDDIDDIYEYLTGQNVDYLFTYGKVDEDIQSL